MLWQIICILCFQYFMVECEINGLKVNRVDRNLIKKQRQDTLDMCRIFREKNGNLDDGRRVNSLKTPYHEKDRRTRRGKRSADYKSQEALADARRVESIVDKLYDDLEENGQKIPYRRRNLDPVQVEAPFNKSGRRYPFAPDIMLGPLIANKLSGKPPSNVKPVDVPWHKKWINGIVPFFIDPNTYDSQLQQKITKAFDYFERATCIRLQRLKDRPTDKKSLQEVEWLYITNPLGIKQCVHSNAIKVNKGVQLVVFGYDCLSLGEIVHEVMHILGFSHEHTRPDRDEHITVLWNNIKPGYKHYFELKSIGTLVNLPYDYSSILHYPSRAFSRNGQFTLLSDKGEGVKLGQRKALSELDIEKVTTIYGNECVDRNQKYLLQTCPSVVKPAAPKQTVSKADIEDYFKDRLWPYGVITFQIRNDVEFSAEEIENIKSVFRHIQKETCIEFHDAAKEANEYENNDDNEQSEENTETAENAMKLASNLSGEVIQKTPEKIENKDLETAEVKQDSEKTETNKLKSSDDSEIANNEISQKSEIANNENSQKSEIANNENSQKSEIANNEISQKSVEETLTKENVANNQTSQDQDQRRKNRKSQSEAKPQSNRRKTNSQSRRGRRSGSRRHSDSILILTRSVEPGCKCPKSGRQDGNIEVKINADCFNSVNDLLHLFVHILGLDHQHNMHDRDEYLKIIWENLTPDMKGELENKLPPAASVGFPYDYLSVMHYPWLQIKNGVANIMYPVWNDGWSMGHWQGLSSTDVQKLNLLYYQECMQRKNLEKSEKKTTSNPHKKQ